MLNQRACNLDKLDVKLQSLCGSGFSLFVGRMLAKPYHFRMNWPTTLCENKDGVCFFLVVDWNVFEMTEKN